MCGLFGIAILGQHMEFGEGDLYRARRARDILFHRGPDQSGEAIADSVYMGHRRLSILDLSESGRQPMISHDGRVAITVNGEIYNFKALRKELEQAGYHFRSHSDSEVVLHGYCHWGEAGLAERMDGMYVAIIHDRQKKTLSFIRDRVGIKPLFYYYDGNEFVWASEAKALLDWRGGTCPLDPEALYDFLTYLYIPSPKSAWKNIFKLLPANILTVDIAQGTIRSSRYWQVPHGHRNEDDQTLCEELVFLVDESVREQLVSDVPVGVFLSGGVDSTVLLYHSAKMHPGIEAFSIGFDDKGHDETGYARIAAEFFGTPHQVKTLHADEAQDIFSKTIKWYDEPFSDIGAVPTFRLCEFARQFVTVAIGGDGGDELFGGYTRYNTFQRISHAQAKLPFFGTARGFPFPSHSASMRKLSLASVRDPLRLYAQLRGGLSWHQKARYRRDFNIPDSYDDLWHFRQYWDDSLPVVRKLQALDFATYLPENIFTKIDRLSMAVSLEARVPFLSRALIEFAFSVPESFTLKNGILKGGMKSAYRPYLPGAILDRAKKGFSMPVKAWNALGDDQTYQERILNTFLNNNGALS